MYLCSTKTKNDMANTSKNMDKRDIFFGETGLTSTSANHIANMAKEFIQVKSALVEHLRFVNRTLTVVAQDAGTPMEVSNGRTQDELEQISQAYEDIYRAKALIAWLREAIKAKESLTDELDKLGLDKYCEIMGIERPKAPEVEHAMTQDEYYATLPLKERVRYYNLETKCAVLGQAIHPNGPFSNARKQMIDSIANPSRLVVNNGTTFVERLEPSMESDALDNFFFELQAAHRAAQSELNTIKFACEKAMAADAIAKEGEYGNAMQQYNARVSELTSERAIYRRKRMSEISALKIVIPEALKPIYDKINGLGKK